MIDMKQARAKRGLSQSRLADWLGVTERQVLRYEREPDKIPHAIKLLIDYLNGKRIPRP